MKNIHDILRKDIALLCMHEQYQGMRRDALHQKMSLKKNSLMNRAKNAKVSIDAMERLATARGSLAMDFLYADIVHDLNEMRAHITELRHENEKALRELHAFELRVMESQRRFFENPFDIFM